MNNDEHIALWPEYDFCIENDTVWFFHGILNCLIKYDLKSETTECMGKIKGRNMLDTPFMCKLFYYKGKIIMISPDIQYIVFYDIDKNNFEYVDSGEYRFRNSFQDAGFIYGITVNGDSIIKFDIEERTFTDKNILIEDEDVASRTLCGVVYEDEDYVLIPVYSNTDVKIGFLALFSKAEKNIDIIKCDTDSGGFYSATIFNNMIYAQGNKVCTLYQIDVKSKNVINEISSIDQEFMILGEVNKKILILKILSREYLSLDVEDNSIATIEKNGKTVNNNLFVRESGRAVLKKYGGGYLLYDCFDGVLYEIKEKWISNYPMLDSDAEKNIMQQIKDEGLHRVCYEKAGFDLSVFLECV